MARHTSALVVFLAWLAAGVSAQELAHDSGQADGKQSSAGTGHVIAFTAEKKVWLTAVRIHGARYGGGYDPEATPFSVSVCDAGMRELAHTAAKYSAFAAGRFAWVDVPLAEPIEVEGEFRVVVAFDPTQSRGVYVSYSNREGEGHSGYGLAGGSVRPAAGREWLIRAVTSSKKPRGAKPAKADRGRDRRPVYLRDLDFLTRTIQSSYPALKKKGIDWSRIKRQARDEFADAADDAQHLRNVHRLIACLRDTHSSVLETEVEVHVPGFDGLYGAGLWIAAERGRLVLRDWMPEHPLARDLARGAELVAVGGEPARVLRERARDQLRQWHGWSSTHFLDARLSFQLFPFGDAQELDARFVLPDGKAVAVKLPRWGPGGRGLSRQALTMPAGLAAEGEAVATMLDGGLGYVRILGGMNATTQAAFFLALDGLRDAKGIVLDCRGMGGGSDLPAWAMAGRFFAEPTPNGTAGMLQPTGTWQFTGPVVMLQDEREASSAETFTWAMTETGRVVSVGRPTGGVTIIPRVFDLPSGLAKFRLGVHDRKTPVRGVQPEGIGTPPDIWVGYDPCLLERTADPILAVGREVLARLVDGRDREVVVDAFAGVLAGDADRLRRAGAAGRGLLPEWLGAGYAASVIGWELLLCGHDDNALPDYAGAAARLEGMAAVAALLGDADAADRGRQALDRWRDEIAAQSAWQELCDRGDATDKDWEAFARKHRGTRYGDRGR